MSTGPLSGFWTILTIVAAACGGILMLVVSHSAEPRHPEAAHESYVTDMAVKLEGVATDVDHNTSMLSDVRSDVSALRTEQRANTVEILSAIRADGR